MVPVMPSARACFSLIFTACVGAMAFALYAQHGLGLTPCPLCIFQRVATMGAGVLALLAALINPHRGLWPNVLAGLVGLAALAGAGVAGWQVKLQLFTAADKIPACGPGLDYMLETLPFAEMLAKVFRGSGECAEITWRLLGLPMPVWSLVFFVGIAGVAMWLASRRPTRWLYR